MPIMVLAAATAFVHLQLAGGATLVAGAYLVLVEQLSRDAGRRIQDHLWKAWDGPPTLHRFRYRNSPSIAQTDILHHEVADLVGWELPTQEDEKGNPVAADAAYDAAVAVIRDQTRDGFDLLHKENANYGFRRNLLGLRRWGITSSLAAALGAAAFALVADGSVMHRASVAVVPLGYAAISVVGFIVLPDDWPRIPAEAYADRLVGAVRALHARMKP